VKWIFINTGYNSGKFNMDLDIELTQKFSEEILLRFYRWKPYCISLGANQPLDSIYLEKLKQDGLDIVKRPTGGRAILHAEELTYSVVHPITSNASPKVLYKEINLALKKGLENYHPVFKKLNLEYFQPHFPSFYKENKSSLCFAVSAKSELNFEGKKLVGSAQRKIGNVVLQHGSILCGTFHKKLVEYLQLSEEEKIKIKNDINSNTIEIESILNAETDYKKLADSLKYGFEESFNISFESKKEKELVA